MIQVNKDDYAIIRYKGKKRLCFILSPGNAVIESTLSTDDPQNIQYKQEEVICNLGPDPIHGSYAGVKVNPHYKTITTKRFGPIKLYTKIEKAELSKLKTSLDNVFNMFKENASVSFLPLAEIGIYPKAGKYAGSYTRKTAGGEPVDFIKLYYDSFTDEKYNEYVLAHEFAHGLFFRCVPTEFKTKWLKLYQKRLKLASIETAKLNTLWDDVIHAEDGFASYIKQIDDDEDRLIFKEIIGYFKRNHRMTSEDVDTMLSYDSEALYALWPRATQLINERPDISQYSLKNVHEFFAEAVAYHFNGKIVPKDVRKALDATFIKCRKV